MKFTILKEDILPCLQQIVSVIEKKQVMPVLSNVLMLVEEDSLRLTGTDLEIQIVAYIDIKADKPGAITVPAKKLLDICRLIPAGAVIKFEQAGDKIRITSGKGRFSMTCLPADNYPEFSAANLDINFTINAGKLKKALDKTVFCMANQDVRFYLNGIMLSIINDKLKVVASDGHRLSIYEDQLDNDTGYNQKIIFPRKGVLELNRLLTDPDAELKVEFSDNVIRVYIKNIVFSAKLLSSNYPSFEKVFNQDFFEPISLSKSILKDTLTRVAILANEKFKGVTLDIANETLRISTNNPDHDEAEDEFPIGYAGAPIQLAFSAQYLLDAITNITSDAVVLTVASNSSSCLITDAADSAYSYIVMPMRL